MTSPPIVLLLLSTFLGLASSFVPKAFVSTSRQPTAGRLEALPSTHIDFFEKFNSLALADDLQDLGVDPSLVESVSLGFLSTLKSVLLVGGGFVAVIFLISVIFASFIIPQAAKELQQQIQRDYPELWNEYQAKLGPGEDLSQRPELIQELGTKLRELQMKEFDKVQAAVEKEESQESDTTTSDSSSANSSDNVVDVEVTKDEKKE